LVRTAFLSFLFVAVALLAVPAQSPQKGEPLTEGEIIRLLQGGVSPDRVESLARDRGISFEVTPAVERDLRDAGATDALLRALHEIASKAAPAAPVQPPPAPAASTLLVIQSKPGQAQVYVDDIFSGKTSSEGVLKIPNLTPGGHGVRLTLAGHQDFEQHIDLPAGETTRYTFELVASQPATPTTPAGPPPGSAVHFSLDRTLKTPVQPVRAIAFGGGHATVATLATLGDDGYVRVWNAVTGDPVATIALSDHPKQVSCLAFSPDSKWVVVGEAFVKAKIYTAKAELLDVAAGQEVRALVTHHWEVTSVAFSPDGKWFVSSNWDRKVRLLEFPSGNQARDFESAGKPRCVAISPDSKIIASGGLDATVSLWGREDGKELQHLTGHTGGVLSVAFSPDGQRVASASGDGSVRIWNVSTGQSLHTLSGHVGAVISVVYSPDGKFVVSGGADNTVRFWDANTGQNLETFGEHSGVWGVAFSADGKYLAAGYADGTINLWRKQD
jgi:WD40 repeat protein